MQTWSNLAYHGDLQANATPPGGTPPCMVIWQRAGETCKLDEPTLIITDYVN